ncbi:MAG: trypsin-like peptidase domain-containing protein [Phycisphaerales bacterium]|nr:trypsin-like peptidase domain-containing protein [Phycisphaerales bacterium]
MPAIRSLIFAVLLLLPGGAMVAQAANEGSLDVIVLKDGGEVRGTIVKRNARTVWIDLGPTLVSFDLEQVADIQQGDSDVQLAADQGTLFSVAGDLPELSPKEHAKRIGSSVVKVSTPSGLGSGVIISPDGHAITNAHVVQGETNLRATVWFVQPDGMLKRTDIDDVELVAVNNHLDLALIRMKHPESKDFVFAPVQDLENLDIGQPVFAIGNPLGLERTLTQGVISTTQRNFNGLTYIQTDTPINPGNSGGPLFNTQGEVIGITNMGILGGEALGFAIPTRYVKDFIRNREAFAYDRTNPNSGHIYNQPPRRMVPGAPSILQDGSSNE